MATSSFLNDKQNRFLKQTNGLLQSGGKLSAAQQQTYNELTKQNRFMNQASNIIQTGGKLNTAQQQTFNKFAPTATQNIQKNDKMLQDLSIKALSGDAGAANYLKAFNVNAKSGNDLWKNVTNEQLNADRQLKHKYMEANPYTDFTKAYDMDNYKQYNQLIQSNSPLSESQRAWYDNTISKWGLEDVRTKPKAEEMAAFEEYMKSLQGNMDSAMQSYDQEYKQFTDMIAQRNAQLAKDKQGALDAQDVALNQGLGAQDATNFQQFQELQQTMANRGMGDSGIAADAYMRSQMGANANYQKAFADSANVKAGIQSNFNDEMFDANMTQQEALSRVNEGKRNTLSSFSDALYNTKLQKQGYINDRQKYAEDKAAAEQAARQKAESDKSQSQIDLMKLQTEQDKYLTTSTGVVYFNGQPLINKGKPITSVEYQKMTETQRHNLATENNAANKNTQDYVLGQDRNSIAREKIAADVQKAMSKLELDYAKLDFDYTKLESTNAIAQDKISIAASNAQTAVDRNQITALGKQSDQLAKQIIEYQKKGKKPPKDIVEKYNTINGQITGIVGGKSFNVRQGGGDIGSLSKKYESTSGGAGTIANNAGDIGGKSYGTYQIATNTGTMKSFMNHLKTTNSSMYNELKGYTIGSKGFDQVWKNLASKNGAAFETIQRDFIKKSHYDPVVNHIKTSIGIDVGSRSDAIQNVVWSIGVQHGVGGAARLLKNAGINKSMSDKEIIDKLYKERLNVDKYFSSSSSSIKKSVKKRFDQEWEDALKMLG